MMFDVGEVVWADKHLSGAEWCDRRRPGEVLLVYDRYEHCEDGSQSKKKAMYVRFLDDCGGVKESADAKCTEMCPLEALAWVAEGWSPS